MKNPKLTFHLMCQDEQEMIGQHIRFLLKVADAVAYPVEFVIVDGGSKDQTLDIINQLKDDRFRIYENPWPGFAAQRNFVKSKSRGEWTFMADADVTASDSIYDKINDLLEVDDEIAAYSFPKIHLVHDTKHMYDKGRDPMMALYRNIPGLTWGGEGLENPMYEGRKIIQHPRNFTFPWQRYVPEVVMIHFAELKSEESKVKKTLKYSEIKNSRWYGITEEEIRKAIKEAKCSFDPTTREPYHKSYKVCPITKYYKDLTFYSEHKEKEVRGMKKQMSSKHSGQFSADYFDDRFFCVDDHSPPKGANRGCVSPHDKYWVDAILQLFGGKGYTFMDVGCGLGWVVKILRERNEEALGVDISEYAIKNSPVPDHVSLGDIATLKISQKYDIVLCNRVLCYLKGGREILTALKNLKEITGRYLVVAVSASDHIGPGNAERALKSRKRLWPKSQWEKWFEGAGLKIEHDLTDQIVKPRLNWDCIWVLRSK